MVHLSTYWKHLLTAVKILGYCNPVQGIWNKAEKSSIVGQEKKGFISNLACL